MAKVDERHLILILEFSVAEERWLAAVAFVGGAGALLGVVADAVSGVAYIALSIWGFAIGARLLRATDPHGSAAPTPAV